MSDDLQLTGGVRHFENDFSNHTYMALPAYASLATPTTAAFDTSDGDTLFKVNASWRFVGRNTAAVAAVPARLLDRAAAGRVRNP